MNLEEYFKEAQRRQMDHLEEAAEIKSLTAKYEAAEALQKFETAKLQHHRMKTACRPCMMLPTTIEQEEEGFSVSYGNLIAYGSSPEIACQNFDRLWTQGEQ